MFSNVFQWIFNKRRKLIFSRIFFRKKIIFGGLWVGTVETVKNIMPNSWPAKYRYKLQETPIAGIEPSVLKIPTLKSLIIPKICFTKLDRHGLKYEKWRWEHFDLNGSEPVLEMYFNTYWTTAFIENRILNLRRTQNQN